jgi:hypothetical protein
MNPWYSTQMFWATFFLHSPNRYLSWVPSMYSMVVKYKWQQAMSVVSWLILLNVSGMDIQNEWGEGYG